MCVCVICGHQSREESEETSVYVCVRRLFALNLCIQCRKKGVCASCMCVYMCVQRKE